MSVVTPMLDSYDMLMNRAKELDKSVAELKSLITTIEELSLKLRAQASEILDALEPLEKEADKKFGKKAGKR